MNIQVIKTELVKKGKAEAVEVSYKNLENGKVASKNVMSFHGAFDVMKDAKEGQEYNVKAEKDKNDYWVWASATEGVVGTIGQKAGPKSSPGLPAPRSTYETPEERARKQVYIVRQSSLATAIEYLQLTDEGHNSAVEDVIRIADQLAKYVLDVSPDRLMVGIIDMKNDVPT